MVNKDHMATPISEALAIIQNLSVVEIGKYVVEDIQDQIDSIERQINSLKTRVNELQAKQTNVTEDICNMTPAKIAETYSHIFNNANFDQFDESDEEVVVSIIISCYY